MAAKLSGDDLTAFNGLANIEQQVAYLLAKMSDAETAYNLANPNATIDRVQFAPNYDDNSLTVGVLLPLTTTNPAGKVPHEAVAAYLP